MDLSRLFVTVATGAACGASSLATAALLLGRTDEIEHMAALGTAYGGLMGLGTWLATV